MNILAFDIETVPDVEAGRCLYGLEGLSDRDTAEAMFGRRRHETGGASEFLRHHLHRVVAISVLLSTPEQVRLWSLGEADSEEVELLRRFFEGIERYSPQLVSWNGRGFDLPVLHYRSLLYGVPAPRYWETGGDDQSFRWNNYLNRFHERHTDLMDVLAGYETRAFAPLDEIAGMLGLPGKMGMSGAQVWERFLAGEIGAVRDYCETDVLNTYLIYLRFQLLRGRLTPGAHADETGRIRDMLEASGAEHLQNFLSAWRA